MPRPRKQLVCVDSTPYYHIVTRCVRRAFLCGVDHYSGKSYEHRRGWVEDRLRVLATLFSLELCAYAIMSNHYHLVVRLNPAEAEFWSDDEVLDRWTSLFRGPLLVQRYRAGDALTDAERETVRSITAVYRARLASLSWFMKCLNEPIARKANAEDGCTGHFWESRFRSQALCSEQALFAAMAYVDLNPIGAGIATTSEASPYTSVSRRLCSEPETNRLATAVSTMLDHGELRHLNLPIRRLLVFDDNPAPRDSDSGRLRLPMRLAEYLALVDITGRVIVDGKRGHIDPGLAPILERLRMSNDQWLEASSAFSACFHNGRLRIQNVA